MKIFMRSREESDLNREIRNLAFYPLNYGSPSTALRAGINKTLTKNRVCYHLAKSLSNHL